MAVNALTLAECLRPWRSAGISSFLADPSAEELSFSDGEDQEQYAALELAQERPQPLSAAGSGPAAAQAQDNAPPRAARAAPQPSATIRPDSAKRPPATADAPREINARDSAGKTSANRTAPHPIDWPEAWQALLERTTPAPIIWTYAELGDDLSGRNDQARAACLRHIIGSLQLPKGSSAFWPVCLAHTEAGATTTADASPSGPLYSESRFFQAGLHRLTPKVIIMLGTHTLGLSGLNLTLTIPFTQQIHKGVLHVLLPGFSDLLARTALKERACAFLRSALAGLPLGRS